MRRQVTSVASPVAHLVGPGKLKVINGRLAFSTGNGVPTRLDPAALKVLYCFGANSVSDRALYLLLRYGVEVAWMSPAGRRCNGRLTGKGDHGTTLRILQHRVLGMSGPCAEIARELVCAKIDSEIAAVRHYQRHQVPEAGPVFYQLQRFRDQAERCRDLEELRGTEGAASATWFRLFAGLLNSPWVFPERRRRPPPDPINALLSLGYTLLLARAIAELSARGLEVNLGALHAYRPGRPSLACDVIEPLRVPSVDRWVVALCHRHQIAPEDFVTSEKGVRLKPARFTPVLQSWEQWWVNGGHRKILDRVIVEIIQSIRHWGTRSPSPVETNGNADIRADS